MSLTTQHFDTYAEAWQRACAVGGPYAIICVTNGRDDRLHEPRCIVLDGDTFDLTYDTSIDYDAEARRIAIARLDLCLKIVTEPNDIFDGDDTRLASLSMESLADHLEWLIKRTLESERDAVIEAAATMIGALGLNHDDLAAREREVIADLLAARRTDQT